MRGRRDREEAKTTERERGILGLKIPNLLRVVIGCVGGGGCAREGGDGDMLAGDGEVVVPACRDDVDDGEIAGTIGGVVGGTEEGEEHEMDDKTSRGEGS